MAKTIQPPSGLHLAALEKRATVRVDLMRIGSGLPWEDRGSIGAVKAYFSTVLAILRHPIATLSELRRPDTTSDSLGFAWICAAAVGLSVWTHFALHAINSPAATEGWVSVLLGSLLLPPCIILLLMLAVRVYFRLIAYELRNRAPVVLIANLMGYCLAPCLLAVVPLVGPPLALGWIGVLWAVVGARRLDISTGGAVIAAILTLASILAVMTGMGLVFWLATLLALG